MTPKERARALVKLHGLVTEDDIAAAITAAVLEEREACAFAADMVVCNMIANRSPIPQSPGWQSECGRAIRARS